MVKINKQIASITAVLIVGVGFGAYQTYLFIDSTKKEITKIKNDFSEMKNVFGQLAENNTLLQEALENERQKSALIEDIVKDLSSDVNVFKKLNELDSELLKKYSKVYFLSENYVPLDLSYIQDDYIYKEGEKIPFHTEMLPFLEDLLRDAKRDNIELFILSGYRSFGDQSKLKSGYVVRYGAGTANSFSAEQGYSEHQLGTTVDFTVKSLSGKLNGFGNTPAYTWLVNNAHRHGFVLSYPPSNNYYTFEPWHWRFVGKKLADDLHDKNMYFYNMAQREIDGYLISIFED